MSAWQFSVLPKFDSFSSPALLNQVPRGFPSEIFPLPILKGKALETRLSFTNLFLSSNFSVSLFLVWVFLQFYAVIVIFQLILWPVR